MDGHTLERMIAQSAARAAQVAGRWPDEIEKRKGPGDDEPAPRPPPLPVGDPADPYAEYFDADTDDGAVSEPEVDVRLRMRLHDRVYYKTKYSAALKNSLSLRGVIVAEVGERVFDVLLDEGALERNVPERLLTAAKQPWKPVMKKSRCLKCEGCLAKECGECDACLDRPSRGGEGRKREICEKRRCAALGYAGQPRAPPPEDVILAQLQAYLSECGAAADAAAGWTARSTARTSGATDGHYDIYFFSPAGKKCRSRAEVARLIGVKPITGGKRFPRL